jgi:hypothetical protein
LPAGASSEAGRSVAQRVDDEVAQRPLTPAILPARLGRQRQRRAIRVAIGIGKPVGTMVVELKRGLAAT